METSPTSASYAGHLLAPLCLLPPAKSSLRLVTRNLSRGADIASRGMLSQKKLPSLPRDTGSFATAAWTAASIKGHWHDTACTGHEHILDDLITRTASGCFFYYVSGAGRGTDLQTSPRNVFEQLHTYFLNCPNKEWKWK
jgi:hypothetical protein